MYGLTRYIIIAYNDDKHEMAAYGNRNGIPFTSEDAADARKLEMERMIGDSWRFLVTPLGTLQLLESTVAQQRIA